MDTKFSVVVLIISFFRFPYFSQGPSDSKLPENLDFMHLDPGPRPKKHK